MNHLVDLVAGARPNFMKVAPMVRALSSFPRLTPRVVDTGQHYDAAMNAVFFNELGIPMPNVCLQVGSGSHGAQTARILERYEAHLTSSRPDAVVVFGDVNSTIACSLAAVKCGIPVAHVEAGLRSFDRTMPEEINRVLTDAVSSLLLVSEPSGLENLRREGIDPKNCHLVGNVMIDTLMEELPRSRFEDVQSIVGEGTTDFGLVTLHRPGNVDDPMKLRTLIRLFEELGRRLPLVFPMHPRTRVAAEQAGIVVATNGRGGLRAVEPLPYRQNLAVMARARVVMTDSGGMQEETSVLGVPCLTLRENTERPITLEFGTSRLVGSDPEKIRAAFEDAVNGRWPKSRPIPLWDGRAGGRIAGLLASWCERGFVV